MAEESEIGQKTWTIVKFVEEDTVAMVPTVWITNTENGWNCFWPPLPANKISVAVKTHQINTCWPSFKVILFRNATYDDYQLARKAASKAEETSDLNTDIDVPAKRKRTIRVLSSSSEEDILVKIRTPPKFNRGSSKANYKKVKVATQNLEPTFQSEGHDHTLFEQNDNFEQSTSKDKNQLSPTQNLGPTLQARGYDHDLFEQSDNLDQRSTSKDKNQMLSPNERCNPEQEVRQENNPVNCTCCPVHVHYTKEILKQIMFLKSRVNDIPIEPVLNPGLNHFTQQSLFENPVINEEALSELNDALKNGEYFEKAVNELSRIGGRNIYDFVVRCLKKLISNELANQYSWLGRRSKKNFSQMEVTKLIMAAAEAGGKANNKKEMEDAISGWLRRANDRLKSKKN